MIDASFPEPNNTSVKKEVGRLGSLEARRLKAQSSRLKAERYLVLRKSLKDRNRTMRFLDCTFLITTWLRLPQN